MLALPENCLFQIKLFGQVFDANAKWHKLDVKSRLEKRTLDTFYGADIALPSLDSGLPALDLTPPDVNFSQAPSKFSPPDLRVLHLQQFHWDKLLTHKVPEGHQLLAFVSAMLENSIVVLPTGSGKTLVASMLLAWMAQANPGRVGLMLVHRVPLMEQQTVAIRLDTGLKVASFGGGNITRRRIELVRTIPITPYLL